VSEAHRNTALWGNEIFPATTSKVQAHISKSTRVKCGEGAQDSLPNAKLLLFKLLRGFIPKITIF